MFSHWSFRSLFNLLTLFLVCSSSHSGTAPVTGLCALGFNFERVYEIRVVLLTLEHSDASRSRRKASGGEAPKENEFVSFALTTILLVVMQPIRRVFGRGWRTEEA